MHKKKKATTAHKTEIGGAVTAAILAASAGAYLLSDKKHHAKLKAWAKRARVEVAQKARETQKLDKEEYGAIVERMISRYGSLENIHPRDCAAAVKELKAQWSAIQAHARKVAKKGATIKTATKKRKSPSVKTAKVSPRKKVSKRPTPSRTSKRKAR